MPAQAGSRQPSTVSSAAATVGDPAGSIIAKAGKVIGDNRQGLDAADAFLRQLIAFPDSQSTGPLSLLPATAHGSAAEPDTTGSAAPTVGEPAASIVAQAASVLDEEMAKGVLEARRDAVTAHRTRSHETYPGLHEVHELVNSLGALLPSLQDGAAKDLSTYQPASGHSEPLAKVSPRAAVKPGERTTVSMTLRNGETRPVRLVPVATDLLGSRGHRIPNSLLEFRPSQLALEPQEQKDLEISITVPIDVAPGCYSGLLIMKGLDYLRALISLEVGMATTNAGTQTLAPPATSDVLNPEANAYRHGDVSGLRRQLQRNETLPSTRSSSIMQEAIKLAEDGELGNSDAIRLLQIPHRSEDVNEVLARFQQELTREAKSKLTLEAFAPLPDDVDNQRYEPIFDRYPITGKTYRTASGTIVLNEVQYYNGEMAQLYGECPNIAEVCSDLAGSGYKPLTMRHVDGRESAVAMFWSHQLRDTSLRPYDAAFIIVAAVPDGTPTDRACFTADQNGASSVLPMFDGAFDPDRRLWESRTALFYVRLLDSTRVAIEVGRERMGTDKRPGTIHITREGKRRLFSVQDGAGNAVAKVDFVIADDPGACLSEVARAGATAGIPFRTFPAGTEYVYPGVARIGTAPIVTWQWRTDVLPRLQHLEPNAVTFDSRSEEGGILIRWGFKPQLLGYIPNVRGVVTGVP
ncbi:hypothetical protein SAZ10_25275 [Mesorhizobium sp. BAC0120]|uniref:hypothetical protein n=1 Tax=Mesorhizobium sp. BAC0120 TaxID=3090670 RepID=UPI00298D25C9|nr:hypothetical protein [Mesorhizobium sp. BAC0120]MDW6025074.1 hypothetical protein [Mesorhizobium sp. BAC0120]